jgi:phosphatidylethanolamine-binding protein
VGLFPLASAIALPQTASSTCSNKEIAPSRAQTVAIAFTSAKRTPQAIKSGISPKVEVNVAYGSKKINLGNTFSAPENTNRPTITFTTETDHDPATTKYLILFVDPDAPGSTANGAPAALSFFHYQATYNASPNCVNPANNGGGTDVTVPPYRALTPLSVVPHRYTQLVYQQPKGFTPPVSLALTTSNSDLNGFVAANQLMSVGGNFFREWLSSVAG